LPILKACDLSLAYKNRIVVKDFNAAISKGNIVGLIGPNGSGKTTILRAFSGLIQPIKGTIDIDGKQLSSLSARKRAQMIGWVPQRERLAWPLTVGEVISLGRAPHRGWMLPLTKDDHLVVEQSLSLTDLIGMADRKVDELSSGEFQRVLIARALAQEPQLLLLDEPTSNLDIHYQIEVMDLVLRLVKKKEISVVVAIHDLAIAARYCDRLVLLHKGEKICEGTPCDVLTTDNMKLAFNVIANLYRDPYHQWAISARNGCG